MTLLWTHGTLPLTLTLPIAGVSVTVVAMMSGTARITPLRRLHHRD